MRGVTVVAVVSSTEDFSSVRERLLASPVWQYNDTSELHELILIDNTDECRGVSRQPIPSAWFNSALLRAKHDEVIFTQPDVYFAAEVLPMLEDTLKELDAFDPEWVVAGAVGKRLAPISTPHYVKPEMFGTYCHLTLGCANTIGDFGQLPNQHRDETYQLRDKLPFIAEVDSLDETFMLVHRRKAKAIGLWFDPLLPVQHGIGSALVLDARVRGRRSYALPTVPLWHRIGYEPHDTPTLWQGMHALVCKFFQDGQKVFVGRHLLPTASVIVDRLDGFTSLDNCKEALSERCARRHLLLNQTTTFNQTLYPPDEAELESCKKHSK